MTAFTRVATAAFVLLVSSILALWHPLQLTGAMVVGIGLILIVAVAIANDLHRIEKKLSEPTDEKIDESVTWKSRFHGRPETMSAMRAAS
jgi:hypothetical protein